MKYLVALTALVAVALASEVPSEEEFQRQWLSFKAEHGKQYSCQEEEDFRSKVFRERLIWVAKHNTRFAKGEVSYNVRINKFADLHSHEIAGVLNGYRSWFKEPSDNVFIPTNRTATAEVESFDWREHGYVTPVKNQGQCGSCWAFSTTGSLEGQLFKKTGKLVSLSEQNLVDCSRKFRNDGCDGGLMDSAFEYIKSNKGIDTEDSYPYEGEDGECRYTAAASAGTDTGYVDIKEYSEDDLKAAVLEIGPISVAIDASHDSFQFYYDGVYDEPDCDENNLDHGVLVVGFGEEASGEKYWIVKNSWGADWGLDGYIKMARNKNNQCGIASSASYPTV